MIIRPRAVLSVFLGTAVFLSGCNTTPEAPQTKTNAAATPDKKKSKQPSIPDQNGDQAFQSFISRLRQVVQRHDVDTLASMMTKNFGYHIDPDMEGDGVFAYWDQNNVWPELELILKERFLPNGNYMVAPAEFTISPGYGGFRAGIVLENGGWKFAYFVSGGGASSDQG